jgi:hypothetical protein
MDNLVFFKKIKCHFTADEWGIPKNKQFRDVMATKFNQRLEEIVDLPAFTKSDARLRMIRAFDMFTDFDEIKTSVQTLDFLGKVLNVIYD